MRFSRSDALFTLTVVVLSLLLGLAYLNEIHTVIARDDARELGVIVFRRRSATRRPGDSLRWERLRSESSVYEGDVIRTAGLSEAGLHFDDGTSLDILENSMVALNFGEMVREFEFLGGTIYIGGDRDATRTARVRVGDIVVEAGSDAQVAVSADGTELSVDVAEGQAQVVRESGQSSLVAANTTYLLNTDTGEETRIAHNIVALWPRQNSRLVHQYQTTAALGLRFQPAEVPQEDLAVLVEISHHPDFSDLQAGIPTVIPAGSDEPVLVQHALGEGQWYWRVRSADPAVELASPVRRFRLLYSELPRLLRPEAGHTAPYRRELPQIRFAWSPVEPAGGYVLELARDAEFTRDLQRVRTAQPGITIDSLDAGSWYWRVSPVLPFEYLHAPGATAPRRLEISRSAAMQPLDPAMPADGTLFEIQEIAQRGLSFSWQPNREARNYQIVLSPSPEFDPDGDNVTRHESTLPYGRVPAETLGTELEEAGWYWAVRWQDSEDSWSPPSAVRRLTVVDGRFAVGLLYPPGGYTIADSLAPTSRFTWNSNVVARTVFQLAQDALFRSVVFEREVTGNSLFGREWDPGNYFWRIRTYNVDGSVFLETPPREVRIAPPLPPTELAQPRPGRTHILVVGDTARFLWEPVAAADYYRFQLFRQDASQPVHEQGLLRVPETVVALGEKPDGAYRAVIQAFALAGEDSTRIIGYRAEFPFDSQRLTPVELQSPTDGEQIAGLTALRDGVRLRWSTPDAPEELSIALQHGGARIPVEAAPDNPSTRVSRLRPGGYVWRVAAELQGFDLSSRTNSSFTVLPVPPMRGPELREPAPLTEYGPEQLVGRDSIRFTWEPLDEANRYVMGLYQADTDEPIVPPQQLSEPEFVLDDLSLLSRGEFRWEVQGQYVADDGYLEQDGVAVERHFRINLPELLIPGGVREVELYGH